MSSVCRSRTSSASACRAIATSVLSTTRHVAPLPLTARGFNAGVFVFNLRAWLALNLTAEAEFWVRANNAEKLYSLGSQPPLTLAIHGARGGTGRCQSLPAEWHLDCLGCMGKGRIKTREQLESAQLYHWNGPNKPFPHDGRQEELSIFSFVFA